MFRAGRIAVATVGALGLGLTILVQAAHAQEAVPARLDLKNVDFTSVLLLNASAGSTVRLAEADQIPMAPVVPFRPKARGGALLSSLFVSTAVMQALDVHSTIKAFDAGAIEANPAMAGITQNRAAFMLTKAAVAATTIIVAHKMSKRSKVAAIVTLVAVNSAYAMIASHNYALARR